MAGHFTQDLRYGVRTLLRSRGFAVIALLTLTLGIGATSAIFSVVDAVLLRSLPYREPGGLVSIYEDLSKVGFPFKPASPGTYADLEKQKQVFEGVAGIDEHADNLIGSDGQSEGVIAAEVTHNLFSLLGVKPLLGRVFRADEDIPGNKHFVLLSYGLWQTRFGADPTLIGKGIRLDGETYTVVGVMPPEFSFPRKEIAVWRPRAFSSQDLTSRGEHYLLLIGRLQPGVTVQQANAELLVSARQAVRQYPTVMAGVSRFFAEPLQESYTRDVRRGLMMLMSAVGLILLIACANVANLLLSRAAGRQREIGLRIALGANRNRIIWQLLTESALLAIAGGVLGILLAEGTFAFLKNLIPEDLSQTVSLSLNLPVLGFAILVSLGSSFLFGLVPALQTSRVDLNDALKEGGRGSTGSKHKRLGNVFVVVEVALSLMLLIGASLLLTSFSNLRKVNPGFRPDHVLTAEFYMSEPRYQDFVRRTEFFERLLERVKAMPGVESAGFTSVLPTTWKGGTVVFTPEGVSVRPDVPYNANDRVVTPGYFETMKIPLLRGRLFDRRDGQNAPLAGIVNETMARKFWPNQNVIGKRLKLGTESSDAPWIQIVGVIGDVKQMGLSEPSRQEIYIPYWQGRDNYMVPRALAIRAAGDPQKLVGELRQTVGEVDREQALSHIMTMDDILDKDITRTKIQTVLLSGLAGLALIMACVGIYGLMAYLVAQRKQEMGIRMAVGAQRKDVLELILGRGMMLTCVGVVIGVGLAMALTRLMSSLLFGVSATNPAIMAGASVLLLMIGLIACLIPAIRAASIDPLQALRVD